MGASRGVGFMITPTRVSRWRERSRIAEVRGQIAEVRAGQILFYVGFSACRPRGDGRRGGLALLAGRLRRNRLGGNLRRDISRARSGCLEDLLRSVADRRVLRRARGETSEFDPRQVCRVCPIASALLVKYQPSKP